MREIVETGRMTIAQKRFDVVGLAKVIDEGYHALEGREPTERQKTSFAPSSIGYGSGTCARRWYFDFEGGPTREDDTDSTSLANMAYGTDAHTRIQAVFDQTGILIKEEVDIIHEDPPIKGYADLLIEWQGEEVVGEIKTTTQESFVSKKSKNQPAAYHLLQVLIYMKVLGLDTGFLLYENKNTQTLMILPVYMTEANQKFVDETFEWMQKVYKNWEEQTLPKRPYSIKSIACKSCPFTKHCWEEQEEGVTEIERLNIPK